MSQASQDGNTENGGLPILFSLSAVSSPVIRQGARSTLLSVAYPWDLLLSSSRVGKPNMDRLSCKMQLIRLHVGYA